MKVHPECELHRYIDVYLNGKKVEEALQADEEKGEVVAAYRDVNGKLIPEMMARPRALVADGLQVIILRGVVEIRVTAPEEMCKTLNLTNVEEVRAFVDGTGTPLVITHAS